MPSYPLVSIVTPSLNQAVFLEETLKSVLSQDYPNLEYIVIDGGSTDGSLDIIRRYEDRIDKWVSEPDKGQSDAINKGFRMAAGEVVAWLNSDDLYFPGAVSRAMASFTADPKLDILYGDGVLITQAGDFLGYIHQVEPFDRQRLLSCYNYISQPASFFRRNTLEKLGYLDTKLNYIMDWDLWCRFAAQGCRFHYQPGLLAADRQYQATKTRSGGDKRLREIMALSRRFRTTLLPHGYFAYAASHMRAKRRQSGGAARLGALAGEAAFGLLNARNLLFMSRRPTHRHGVFHGIKGRGLSQAPERALGFEARIAQPLFRPAGGISIGLRRHEGLDAGAVLSGTLIVQNGPQIRVELSPQEPESKVALELPAAVRQGGQLLVDFCFEPKEKSQGRPNAAAWLTDFSLIAD